MWRGTSAHARGAGSTAVPTDGGSPYRERSGGHCTRDLRSRAFPFSFAHAWGHRRCKADIQTATLPQRAVLPHRASDGANVTQSFNLLFLQLPSAAVGFVCVAWGLFCPSRMTYLLAKCGKLSSAVRKRA